MMGPGKYDDLCTLVRERAGMAGGVVLIVLGGNKGNGFSCQADLPTTMLLPDLLESMAAKIRADLNNGGNA